jgi:hypothetical protein
MCGYKWEMRDSRVIHATKRLKTKELPGGPETRPDSRKEALLAVVNSPVFQRAARLREFLLFTGTCALEGRERDVTEHQIGIHVFGKDETFNPAEDNIVRASARMLRVKLREYFDAEGPVHGWRIEVPKGSYIPVFAPAEPPAMQPPVAANARAPRWVWVAIALLTVLSTTLGIALIHQRSGIQAASDRETLWSVLMRGHPNVNIVASDALHGYYQLIEGRLTPLNSYASGEALPAEPPAGSKQLTVSMWPMLLQRNWSDIDDLRVAVRLVTNLPERGGVDLFHSRQLRVQSFRKGEDFLIVGGLRATPWGGLFESELNFRMVFPDESGVGEFQNRNPKEGEQRRYVADAAGGNTGHAYARIAIVPGLAGRGRVVLVAGTTGPATDAAGELLLSPTALAEVQKRLGRVLDGRQPAKLEILLGTSTVSGATKDFRVVALR